MSGTVLIVRRVLDTRGFRMNLQMLKEYKKELSVLSKYNVKIPASDILRKLAEIEKTDDILTGDYTVVNKTDCHWDKKEAFEVDRD